MNEIPEKTEIKLTEKQERFCQLYSSSEEFFCNGVQSYIEAYKIDLTQKGAYDSARSSAYDNLTKPHILRRINEIFEARGLNDAFVDKQLEKMVTQDADFNAKIQAIKEYNKLKQRIVDQKNIDLKLNRSIEDIIKETENEIQSSNTNAEPFVDSKQESKPPEVHAEQSPTTLLPEQNK